MGTVAYSVAYDPYGGIQKTWGTPTYTPTMKFSGKERDAESQLDYFGARYYDRAQYRFISVDPVINVLEAIFDPQLWNLYSFCRNNPIIKVDPNGQWPASVHDKMIDEAFPDLTDKERDILKKTSREVDKDQSSEGSRKHGMRAPGQTVEQGEEAFNEYINQKMQEYKKNMAEGKTKEALKALGELFHALTDSISPSHTGFQVWPDNAILNHPILALKHFLKETPLVFQLNPDFINQAKTLLKNRLNEANK